MTVFERADTVGAASLHEAGGRIGALPCRIRPLDPALEICGPAYPVRCPAGDNLFLHYAILQAAPGDILVVDGADAPFGYLGDIMALAAQQRGLGGLVIAGGVRDSRALIAMRWPVFASHVAIQGTVKNPDDAGSIGAPVRIGGVEVAHGDLVRGDADGVVVLPARLAGDIVARAVEREREEERIAERLRAGETTVGIYGLPALGTGKSRRAPTRRSIAVEGLGHGSLPIPAAARIGGVIASGGIRGVDPATGAMPDDDALQVALMFDNVRRVMEAAGASVDAILKMTIWIAAAEVRGAINGPWCAMFPDPESRPARHILAYDLPGGMRAQCEILAITEDKP